ncbi:SOS response-associated peptidase [Colwellia sp. M166]|uniref:SOS response-associated peptidase n=1 Tax=Colwellia sp. M166 TaxID=2583805 RepID=UPI00211E2058|nr:SOS response-associated peptidase [Colwellia sp. M166]
MNIDTKLCPIISEFFGINFTAPNNDNLSPGQTVSTIINTNGNFNQLNVEWGIKPNWSKRLLINAQSETVIQKPTFSNAIQGNRCLIPCSGWYEWRTENGKKQRYLFSNSNGEPFLMAGIWYQSSTPQLVTLTTTPNEKCGQYHKRMPVMILPQDAGYWFQSPVEQLFPLFEAIDESIIDIAAA